MQNTNASKNNLDRETSTLVSRNITVQGRRTSVRLEPEMWVALKEIAVMERCTIHDICTLVSVRKKQNTSLTAAVRVFVMLYFRAATTEDGHRRAGHGDFSSMIRRARITGNVKSLFSGKRHRDGADIFSVPGVENKGQSSTFYKENRVVENGVFV